MAHIGYLGGVVDRACGLQLLRSTASVGQQDSSWQHGSAEWESSLAAWGKSSRLFAYGRVGVLIRGQVDGPAGGATPAMKDIADELHRRYLRAGYLEIASLRGSFTIALIDAPARRVLLYRNLIGQSYTYYASVGGGLVFCSNLSLLLRLLDSTPVLNEAMLPAYFLFRYVPGRETLVHGIHRLMPGETLAFEHGKISLSQTQTLDSLAGPPCDLPVERVENALAETLRGYMQDDPDCVNLLSGGVDSSYLQAIWNGLRPRGHEKARSCCVTVDHALTREDLEYALSAARVFGTSHTCIPATERYCSYLLDTIATTAEPPNHVQTAYFGSMARALRLAGTETAMCGEGADGLFGTDTATVIQYAQIIRRLLPYRSWQRTAGRCARFTGRDMVQEACELAPYLDDPAAAQHPANRASVFTDWDTVEACFGSSAVASATAYRRSLLHLFARPLDPIEMAHGAGFLGEGIESASLWTTIFNDAGVDLYCPFLDSRLLAVVMSLSSHQRFPFRRHKALLREGLSQHAPAVIANRQKRGFGQPIFQWLRPGGQLHPLALRIGHYDFLPNAIRSKALKQCSWFLYSLLCLDIWHKLFVQKAQPKDLLQECNAQATLVSVS